MIKEKLYTTKEVQEILQKKSVITIYRYIESGLLKATKIQRRYYINEKDLREFLNIPEDN